MKNLKITISTAALCAAALFLTSCIEDSTIIRIRKDGSGEIFARSYVSPQVAQMMGGIGEAFGGTGQPGDTVAEPEPVNPLQPDQETLAAAASGYGEGVRFVRHEKAKNAKGWEGFVAVYEFDDVSKLQINPYESPAPDDGSAAEATTEAPVTFAMSDGVLTINVAPGVESFEGMEDATGGDEGAEMPMEMMKGMIASMRFGTLIRIDGAIAETNAQHVNGTMITLSDIQPGKMLSDPNYETLSKEAEAMGGAQADKAQMKALMDKMQTIDGLTLETQEQITVRFE